MARKHFKNIFVYYPSGFDDILPTSAKWYLCKGA
jgi:hypothetical protein